MVGVGAFEGVSEGHEDASSRVGLVAVSVVERVLRELREELFEKAVRHPPPPMPLTI